MNWEEIYGGGGGGGDGGRVEAVVGPVIGKGPVVIDRLVGGCVDLYYGRGLDKLSVEGVGAMSRRRRISCTYGESGAVGQ